MNIYWQYLQICAKKSILFVHFARKTSVLCTPIFGKTFHSLVHLLKEASRNMLAFNPKQGHLMLTHTCLSPFAFSVQILRQKPFHVICLSLEQAVTSIQLRKPGIFGLIFLIHKGQITQFREYIKTES